MPPLATRGLSKEFCLSETRHARFFRLQGSRVPSVVVYSRQRGFATESLEHAIAAINKIIFEQEQRRQRQRASRADATKGRVEVDVQPKPITFKASAKTEKLVKEPTDINTGGSARGLAAYLALPLDQYSLLDPGWISRSPAAPDVFVLRIPLFDLVGLDLQPQITVRVSLDPRNNQVHFLADQFKVGDPRFDEDFKLHMRATLRNKPVPTLRPLRSIKRMWSRAGRGGAAAGAPAAGDGTAAAGSDGLDTAGVVSAAATGAAGIVAAAGTIPSGQDGGLASAQAPRASPHDPSSSAPSSSHADVEVVMEAESVGTGAEGGQQSGRWEGASSWRRDTPDSAYERYRHQDPAAALDVGIQQAGPGRSSGAGGGGGVRPQPDLPPHVTVVSYDLAGNATERGTRGGGGGDGTVARAGGASNITSASNTTSNTISSNNAPGLPYIDVGVAGVAAGATAAGPSTSTTGLGGAGAQAWPTGAYGPGHPANSTGAPSSAATTARPSLTAAAGTLTPLRPWAAAAAPAYAAASPAAPASGASGTASAGLSQRGASGTGAVRGGAANTTTASPSGVLSAAMRPGPLSPSSAAALPPGATSEALPFIEDEVLYVPASQWGRGAGDTASTSTAPAGAAAGGARQAGAPGLRGSAAAAGPVLPAAVQPLAGPSDQRGALAGSSAVGAGSSPAAGSLAASTTSGALGADAPLAAAVVVEGTTGGFASGASRGSDSYRAAVIDVAVVSSSADPLHPDSRPRGLGAGTSGALAPAGSAAGAGPVLHRAEGAAAGPASASTSTSPAPGAVPASASTSDGPASASLHSHPSDSVPGRSGATEPTQAATPVPSASSPSSGSSSPSSAVVAAAGPQAGSGAEEGPTSMLVGNVDVAVTVALPPALAAVPRPLLGMTGSLIARYAISSLLPSFLDLLVADYGRWSTGQTVDARAAPAGDLAAAAAANAAAMGADPGRNAAQQMASAVGAGSQQPGAAAGSTPPPPPPPADS